ncbi:hypothetical protein MMC08_009114 [Hypocenomyce scalaris]|nr:hypothetical protein [Hypocenomyce scalaris]
MPNSELVKYFDAIPSAKWLRYKSMVLENNIHEGVDYRYDHQGTFTAADGKKYHNLQVQLNKQAKSANLKGVSRKNGTCPSAACVLVANAWAGPENILRGAMEQSNDLGDGKSCRKIWLYEDGTTEPMAEGPSKSDKAAEERKAAKEAKEAGDAKRRAKRN